MKPQIINVDMRNLETWDGKPEYKKKHRGYGICNTGANWPMICHFGGIGCNVDHQLIGRDHNLTWPPPDPVPTWDYWLKDLAE